MLHGACISCVDHKTDFIIKIYDISSVVIALLECNVSWMLLAGDENKEVVLAIASVLEKLLLLIDSDDRCIRRSACMAFASLCAHGNER